MSLLRSTRAHCRSRRRHSARLSAHPSLHHLPTPEKKPQTRFRQLNKRNLRFRKDKPSTQTLAWPQQIAIAVPTLTGTLAELVRQFSVTLRIEAADDFRRCEVDPGTLGTNPGTTGIAETTSSVPVHPMAADSVRSVHGESISLTAFAFAQTLPPPNWPGHTGCGRRHP
jgi:hypothetical protein